MYYVTIQTYWNDPQARRCVELARTEPSPGMLTGFEEHYVETEHYWIAARAAVASSEALGFPITFANSFVYGDPDDPADPLELLTEAELAEAVAPKCEYCGSPDDVQKWEWWSDEFPGDEIMACSGQHADLVMEERYPYVVTAGMPGYMPNSAYRFETWDVARRYALDEAKRWRDDKGFTEPELDVSYSNDDEYFGVTLGYESLEAFHV